MFASMKFKTTDFNKCCVNSFLSFFYSIYFKLFNRIFDIDVIPGICGID